MLDLLATLRIFRIRSRPLATFAHVDIRIKRLYVLFETYHPDYVVNFAAESQCDIALLKIQALFADTNVMGTVALLSVAESFLE